MGKKKDLAVVITTAIFIYGLAILTFVRPDRSVLVSERRNPAALPEITVESVKDGSFVSGMEDYMPDNFFGRQTFRTLKALSAFYVFRQTDNNKIYIYQNSAVKMEYPYRPESIAHATQSFSLLYETYLQNTDSRVYVTVVPDKNYFAADKKGALGMDYQALVGDLTEQMPYASYIDIFPDLEPGDYYRTDLHWSQPKITGVAQTLAKAMGSEISRAYEERNVDADFYGIYYGQAALPMAADKISYLTNETIEGMTVYDYETNAKIPVYDLEKTGGSDPYEMFLGGSKALLSIKNPNGNGRKLVLIRDSFGSSIAPLLATGYSETVLVDIRYMVPVMVGRFVDMSDCDVLFLYSTSVLNNSETIK